VNLRRIPLFRAEAVLFSNHEIDAGATMAFSTEHSICGSSGTTRYGLRALALGSCALAGVGLAEPAQAQNFGAIGGAVLGHAIGAAIGAQGYRRAPQRRQTAAPTRSRGKGDAAAGGQERAPKSDEKILASLGVPSKTQTAILKDIVPATTLAAVGSNEDRNQLGRASNNDSDRDYISITNRLIGRFKGAEESQRASGLGDITQHAILQAVDDAYKATGIEKFTTFVGEDWTQDRLRVTILRRVDSEVGSLLNGTNKGRVSMQDLRGVIDRSAQAVFQRIFETSELLAANRSSALFVQLLYQNHDTPTAADVEKVRQVREGAERMLMRAAVKVSGEFDKAMRADSSSYALGYRKERIIFDCLSDSIAKVTSAIQGVAEPAEVEKRIGQIAGTECRDWVTRQFLSADRKLIAQQPFPLRVVWSKDGPIDNPSMYSRSGGSL